MTKVLKNISLLILCIVCFIPYLLVLTGHAQIIKGSGGSTMGVIIGPVIIPEDGLIGGGSGWSPDYSSSNLSPNTPYADGALRGYSTIGVYNVVRDTKSWNGFKYASYIRYFRISRTDGRLIYDDDGILDVSTSRTNLTDEVVNYPSYIYSIETKLPIKSGAGFLWTDQQAKFKSGGELSVTFYFADSSNGSEAHIYDMPTKPSDKTNKLSTIMYENSTGGPAKTYDCFAVSINATGQYENTFWGNTGGDVSVSANLTNYIAISERDWSNELTTNDYVGKGTYKGCTTYYSPKDFTVIARNLNNLLKVNDVEVTSQYGTSVVPYKDGHHISISEEGLTKVQIENGAEGRYTTYYCFIDETLPDVNYIFHNANALEKRVVGNIITNSNGSKSQTIYEGIFKDQVQINFGYDENTESPEIATCTFNGNTFEIQNGQWFNEEGEYTITVTDLAGNTTISKFTIDKNAVYKVIKHIKFQNGI